MTKCGFFHGYEAGPIFGNPSNCDHTEAKEISHDHINWCRKYSGQYSILIQDKSLRKIELGGKHQLKK